MGTLWLIISFVIFFLCWKKYKLGEPYYIKRYGSTEKVELIDRSDLLISIFLSFFWPICIVGFLSWKAIKITWKMLDFLYKEYFPWKDYIEKDTQSK